MVECREVVGGEGALGGSWLEMGLKHAPDVDGGLKALGPAMAGNEACAEALAPEAARRALELGMDLARDPTVQAAIAKRCGVSSPAAVESETDALRTLVATLTKELEEVRKQQAREGAGGATDDERSVAKSLDFQKEAFEGELDDVEEVPSIASTDAGDSVTDFFASLNVERVERETKAAEDAAAEADADAKVFPDCLPKDPDQSDPTTMEEILGAALAVASLVLLVAVTRKMSPTLAKRAALLSAAALAGVLGKFSSK